MIMDNEEYEEEIDENEEPRRESSYELGRRLKRERARQDYLDRHPFHKDSVEIKPIKAVIELAQKHFEDNENSDEFELQKAVLGSRLGIGSTKTLSVCNALAGEYDFITDSRGSIIIDRKGFHAWLKLREELEKERERNISQNRENQVLSKEIQDYKGITESNDKALTEIRKERDRLKVNLEELNKEKESLPNEIKELQGKISTIKAELEKEKKKGSGLNNELSKASNELKEIEEENRQKTANLQIQQKTSKRKKDMTTLELLNEDNTKLMAENRILKENIEDRKRRVRIETVESLKAGILFLFKFCFPFVVSFYLWKYLQIYEWYWLVVSLILFWIIYLWLVFRDWD